MSFFTFSVSAADEISTFGITMSGFKGGAKESDVTFSLSDDRLEISQVSWVGTMKEDGTFKNQKVYNVFITVKIKSGTAYTVNYAELSKIPVINLAKEEKTTTS